MVTIKQELKKNIGKGMDIDFPSAGFIFGNGVKGIINRILEPHFVELDFCNVGGKIQVINISLISTYSILDNEETKELKDYYRKGNSNGNKKRN